MDKRAAEKPAMDVVFCIDENFAMPCGIALYSLLHTNKDMHINLYIIGQGLSEASKNALVQTAENHDCVLAFYTYNGHTGGGASFTRKIPFYRGRIYTAFYSTTTSPHCT